MNLATVDDINEAHRLARTHAESAVQYAIRCGELLALKKTELRHGEFKPWIAANCEFSYDSAAAYMRVAKAQKLSALNFSSLREALGYDKPERKPSPAKTCPFPTDDASAIFARVCGFRTVYAQVHEAGAQWVQMCMVDDVCDGNEGAIFEYMKRGISADHCEWVANDWQPDGANSEWECIGFDDAFVAGMIRNFRVQEPWEVAA